MGMDPLSHCETGDAAREFVREVEGDTGADRGICIRPESPNTLEFGAGLLVTLAEPAAYPAPESPSNE